MFTSTREIRIETSTVCNYNCTVCPRDSFVRNKEIMPQHLFEDIIGKCRKELPEINTITISGFGEFSADKCWRNKIIYAEQFFDKINILSNMSLLSRTDLDFLSEHIQSMRISLYGVDETSYATVHRPPKNITYAEVRDKIKYLCTQEIRPLVLLNYLLLPENRDSYKQWISEWQNYADSLEVWKPHNWIEGRSYRSECTHRKDTCGRPFKGPVQVQVDGTINVCCFDYNGELEIGDLKLQSFYEVFNSSRMKEIQQFHKKGLADRIPQCRVCDQRDCDECKQENLVYSSNFTSSDRINKTSTEYENLNL